MPRLDYVHCAICGKHAAEVGVLSHNRLCATCGVERFEDNLVALKTMNGPFALRWRQRLAASVGAVLPERIGVR